LKVTLPLCQNWKAVGKVSRACPLALKSKSEIRNPKKKEQQATEKEALSVSLFALLPPVQVLFRISFFGFRI
jgi:hypothetical protein